MKYKLINPINSNYSALEQVLTNRGIEYENIPHYINTTDEDINSYSLLGESKLREAALWLTETISNNDNIAVLIDPDVDGYCSSAILINYLHDIFPSWAENHIFWHHHIGKQHGLNDVIDELMTCDYKLVITPDSGTNDAKECQMLYSKGIKVIVLDHHLPELASKESSAIIINNQLPPYPNKDLCGGGVVYQFCRYLDSITGNNKADNYLDLVALSNTADMMSLKSYETKHLINKGFKTENIHNPFIYYMWQKNKFKLGDNITSWGAAFYIAPLLNAIVRSGTQDEKESVFCSMLNHIAFEKVLSNKRGHKLGEEEPLIEQVMRICTNVKNRQTKAVDAGMGWLEKRIEENNMLKNKVLLFLINPGEIEKNIAGLVANKIMAKYQRPCCILTRVEENLTIPIFDAEADYWDAQADIYGGRWEKGNYVNKNFVKVTYQGSARGCDKVGATNFKDVCENSGCIDWSVGHKSAFGLSLLEHKIDDFIKITNEMYKDMSDEPIYYVDYIYNGTNVNPQNILDIADMDCYWGMGCEESLIAIKGLIITKDMVTLMSPDKSPTLKITLPNKVSIIKFGSSQEEYEEFTSSRCYVEVDIVGKCNKNCWMNYITPQIFIEDYEIVDSCNFYF